jgi:hypothetical protein
MTFDAGSIEARLELNRDAFQRGLREATAEGQKFESQDFTAEIKVDGTAEAEAEFATVDSAYEALRENLQRTINVEVDADTAAADAELEATTALADRLDRKRVNIGAIFGGGSGGGLLSLVSGLGDSFAKMGENISGGSVVWTGLVSSIIAAAPLIVAALAPVLGITAALGVGLVGAMASIGGVAAVAIPQLSKVVKAQQDLNKAREAAKNAPTEAARTAALQKQADILGTLTGAQKGMLKQLTLIQDQWGKLQKQFGQPLANALKPWFQVARSLLGQLPALILPGLEAFKTIGQVILPIVHSREFRNFIKELGTFGAFAFTQFADAGIALAHAFIEIFKAFEPLARLVLPGLVNLVRQFAEWAAGLTKSAGFKAFIAYVVENGPVLGKLLMNLLVIFVKLGIGLAPLGAIMLRIVGAIASFLAQLSPNQLLAIIVAVTALGTALALAFAGVPLIIAAVVAGVIALAAIIVNYWGTIRRVWNRGVNFLQNTWHTAWLSIRRIFDIAVNLIQIGFLHLALNALKLVDRIITIFAKLPGPLGAPFRKAKDAIEGTMAKMQDQIREHLNNIQSDFDKLHGKKVTVLVAGSGTWKALSQAGQFAGGGFQAGQTKHPGMAEGGRIPGFGGGDKHLRLLEGGEAVVSKETTSRHAAELRAWGVPGMAAGGITPSYRGNAPGVGPWTSQNVVATEDDIVSKTAQSMADAWKKYIDSLMSAGGVGGGVSLWAPLVLRVLAMLGQSASWLPLVLRRMNQESGGNPMAINLTDSNAMAGDPSRGLMQTIGSTFATFAGPFRGLGIYNPLANIYAGLNYALHRYGSLSALGQPGGYDKGGPLPHGLHLVANRTGGTEEVLTPAERRAFVAMAKSGGNNDLLVRLDRLIKAVEKNAVVTAAGVAEALNGTARGAAYRAAYSTRGV